MKKFGIGLMTLVILLGMYSTNAFGETKASSSEQPVEMTSTTEESQTNESSQQAETQQTSESNKDEEKILVEMTSEKFSPVKYGVSKLADNVYYSSIEDAWEKKDPQPIGEELLILDELFSSELGKVYQGTRSDKTTVFMYESDILRNESDKYTTLTNDFKGVVFKDITLSTTQDNKDVEGKTYRIQEEITVGGTTYVSLFNKENEFIGLVNKTNVALCSGEEGSEVVFNKYVTVTTKNKEVYENFDFKVMGNTSQIVNKTYLAKTRFYHHNGDTYIGLYDLNNKFKGYVNEAFVTVGEGRQGAPISYDKYVILVKDYDIWKDFSWQPKAKANQYKNQVFKAREIYYHINGSEYLSLYNNKDQLVGYISREATKDSGAQGAYVSYNKYITIKNQNYSLWSNFNWTERHNTKTFANKTFQARGIYYHFNGDKYLSVYDNKGYWLGYLNANGATVANAPEGSYRSFNRYVSVTNNNYNTWQNFSWKKKNKTNKYINQTVYAKGVYHHYNGSEYYSLYNNKNQWLGYVNKNAVTLAAGSQGIYHSYGKRVTMSSRNYNVYRNFNGDKKNVNVKNKTYTAKGIYYHFNGARYFSLYDGNKWVGYINANAEQSYDMNKLIPNQESILAVHQVVQQKILDTSSNPRNVIDRVLSMSTINRRDVTYEGGYFVVSLKGKNVGTNAVKLTPKEIAPAVNYRMLPQSEIKGAIPSLNRNKKYVALTFDDGPNPYTTPQLLNTLKQNRFF
ncbi:MAG: hypothetical protein RR968_01235 [Vagococcus sp.]